MERLPPERMPSAGGRPHSRPTSAQAGWSPVTDETLESSLRQGAPPPVGSRDFRESSSLQRRPHSASLAAGGEAGAQGPAVPPALAAQQSRGDASSGGASGSAVAGTTLTAWLAEASPVASHAGITVPAGVSSRPMAARSPRVAGAADADLSDDGDVLMDTGVDPTESADQLLHQIRAVICGLAKAGGSAKSGATGATSTGGGGDAVHAAAECIPSRPGQALVVSSAAAGEGYGALPGAGMPSRPGSVTAAAGGMAAVAQAASPSAVALEVDARRRDLEALHVELEAKLARMRQTQGQAAAVEGLGRLGQGDSEGGGGTGGAQAGAGAAAAALADIERRINRKLDDLAHWSMAAAQLGPGDGAAGGAAAAKGGAERPPGRQDSRKRSIQHADGVVTSAAGVGTAAEDLPAQVRKNSCPTSHALCV